MGVQIAKCNKDPSKGCVGIYCMYGKHGNPGYDNLYLLEKTQCRGNG